METFANNAVGNLNASILIGATSLVLQAGQGALFPATGNFRIVIGTEIIIVGARSGDTLSSLTRGAESTAAAAHTAGDVVTHDVTKGSLSVLHQELDYVETGVTLTVAATTEATSNTVVTSSTITYDGATPILIEFYAPRLVLPNVAGGFITLTLWDGSTDLGIVGAFFESVTAQAMNIPCCIQRRYTPSNAAHTYSIRAYRDGGGGLAQVSCGAGGISVDMPAFIRITRA